jgi:hypothetical protein
MCCVMCDVCTAVSSSRTTDHGPRTTDRNPRSVHIGSELAKSYLVDLLVAMHVHAACSMQQHGNRHVCCVMCVLCIGQCACIVHLPLVYMAEPYIFWAFTDDWNVGVAMTAKHRTTDIGH